MQLGKTPILIDEASPNSIESAYNKKINQCKGYFKKKSSASRESLYKIINIY
jgi:hypothetical protein